MKTILASILSIFLISGDGSAVVITKAVIENMQKKVEDIRRPINKLDRLLIKAWKLLDLAEKGEIELTSEHKEIIEAAYSTFRTNTVDAANALPVIP